MYSAVPAIASGASPAATSSAMVLSGPTTSQGAEPSSAYTTNGSSSEYSPAVTGSPAMSA